MRNRAQAESWGEKFLSIVDFTRNAAILPNDIPVGVDGTHATPDGIRKQGRNFAKTYANEAD